MEQFDSVMASWGSNQSSAPEVFFETIGLYSPITRAIFGAVVGYLIVQAVRPSFMFNKDGTPRGWSMTGGDAPVVWWMLPLGLAIYSGLFI